MPWAAPRSEVMQKNIAHLRQYFPYAAARGNTPDFTEAAENRLSAAQYTRVISIAYTGIWVNAWMYDITINPSVGEDDKGRARSAARIPADRRAGTDLYSKGRSRPAAFASGRLSGAAGGTGMLRGRSQDDEATGEAHLLMPKGEVH